MGFGRFNVLERRLVLLLTVIFIALELECLFDCIHFINTFKTYALNTNGKIEIFIIIDRRPIQRNIKSCLDDVLLPSA